MKSRYFALTVGACLFATGQSFAAASGDAKEAQLQSDIQKITAQTQQLQQEVKDLKTELRQVKRQRTVTYVSAGSSTGAATVAKNGSRIIGRKPVSEQEQIAQVAQEANQPQKTQTQKFSLGSIVTTSPYIGLRSAYDASDLIVNQSTMNEDLRLLQQRQALENNLTDLGIGAAKGPMLMLSGALEGQVYAVHPYVGSRVSNIDLTRAELDTLAMISPWAQGFMSLTYDNTFLPSQNSGSGNVTNNSRITLKRGFMTVGNLNKSPFYFSLGQMYVPFGIFTSDILTDPQTKLLARTTARAALVGFDKKDANGDDISAQVYAYNGPSNVRSNGINDFGANAGYQFSIPNSIFSGSIGGGFINNIADSILMQTTYSSGFPGFSNSITSEAIVHRVDAVDGHAQVNAGPFSVYGEYIAAAQKFDPSDLTFNGVGARPSALYAEADYNFKIFDEKPAAFALGYGESWRALALGGYMPKNSYIAAFNTSIWKNTIESIEYRHDVNYAATDVAGGRCNEGTFCNVPSVGGQQNMITAQIGVYF